MLIAFVGVILGLPSLPEPFGVDQGIYGYIAERLLEGAVDHRDVFDHKPPGIHAAYAAAFALFGHNMWSVRVLDLIVAILTGCCLCILAERLVRLRMGLICGLLYVAYYEGFFNFMSRAQPEAWVNLTFVAALALIVGRRSVPAMILSGAALGAGFWFKPTIVVLGLLWVAVLAAGALRESGGGWRRFGLDLACAAAGALAVCLTVVAYYVAHGALGDFYEAVFVFNLRYHSTLRLLRGFGDARTAILFVARPLYALVLLLFVSCFLARSLKQGRPFWIGLTWLGLGLLTVFWQGSFARSHYALVIPPLVFLAAFALDGAVELATSLPPGKEHRQRVQMIAVGVVLAACLVIANISMLFSGRWTKFVGLASGELPLEAYYAKFWLKGMPGRGGYNFEDLRQIGAYLEERTEPDETVFVWGYRPIIAYLAKRRMPTRFNFRYPLTRVKGDIRMRWWSEFLGDLKRAPPAYFVVALRDRGLYHSETSMEALRANQALRPFVDTHYEHVRTVKDFEIYKLRPDKNL